MTEALLLVMFGKKSKSRAGHKVKSKENLYADKMSLKWIGGVLRIGFFSELIIKDF